MALGCKKKMHVGEDARKRNPRREESETKEEGVPTTTTINFHMCEVPERLPFTGRATQAISADAADPTPTQLGTTPSSPERLKDADDEHYDLLLVRDV